MRRADGFTLLEVMVALAIAVPALLVLYRQGTQALDITGTALAYEEAIARAQSRLATITGAALEPGDRDGDDGSQTRWHTRVTLVATAPAASLYDVSVQSSWAGGRSVTLRTRRLGPARGDPP